MTKFKSLRATALLLFVFAITPFAMAQNTWVPASGLYCLDACNTYGGAVVSGQYGNTSRRFAVCRASVTGGSGDKRGGFNITGETARCRVAYGYDTVYATTYDCLCRPFPDTTSWKNHNGQYCINACETAGYQAVVSGQYGATGRLFAVCRAGNRTGFNITGDKSRCRYSYGDDAVHATNYDCLCTW